MLSQIHAATDLAADRRRTLLAEAEDYRLAREAQRAAGDTTTPQDRPRGWLPSLRAGGRRAAAGA